MGKIIGFYKKGGKVRPITAPDGQARIPSAGKPVPLPEPVKAEEHHDAAPAESPPPAAKPQAEPAP